MSNKIFCKMVSLFVIVTLLCAMTACGTEEKEVPTVQIRLWSEETSIDMLKEQLNEYKELHKEEVNFEFVVNPEGEDTCKATVLRDPKAAADIYAFADDQLDELHNNGALLEITKDKEEVIENVGGEDSGAAQAAMRDAKLYAYPVNAGNGYFLYYNKAYFSEDDVKSLDKILEIAAKNKKKFTMDYQSGWYIFSFFKAAGLDVKVSEDGKANSCEWNAKKTKYSGVDVVKSMLAVAKHKGFVTLVDDDFVKNVKNGTVIAGINGPWNASKVEKAWGSDYAATMLPAYTLKGDQVQMCSMSGYKMLGINAYTQYPEYCMDLAKYLTNEDNQIERFQKTGECPANQNAAAAEEVQKAPAIAALSKQAKYGVARTLAEPYWKASSKLGIVLAAGNPDDKDLRKLLDSTVKEIEKPLK